MSYTRSRLKRGLKFLAGLNNGFEEIRKKILTRREKILNSRKKALVERNILISSMGRRREFKDETTSSCWSCFRRTSCKLFHYCSVSCKIDSILSIGIDVSSDEVVKQILTRLNSSPSTMLPKSGRSTALVSCYFSTSASWIIKSGANYHMTSGESMFSSYSLVFDGSLSTVLGNWNIKISEDVTLYSILGIAKRSPSTVFEREEH